MPIEPVAPNSTPPVSDPAAPPVTPPVAEPVSLLDTPPVNPPAPVDAPPAGDPPADANAPTSLLGDGASSAFAPEPVDAATALEGLTLPEGFTPDPAQVGTFVEMINNATSRADIVKGSLELLANQQGAAETALSEDWDATQNAWRDEVKADPKLGGAHFEQSLATARTVIETYSEDPAAIKELFALTGAGNSLHMVRLLNSVAAAIPGEAPPVSGTPQPVTASRANKLFGT